MCGWQVRLPQSYFRITNPMSKDIKIVLIGSGAVGTSFVYSAINQGLGQRYGIIDIAKEVAIGHAMDLEDALPVVAEPAREVFTGDYDIVKDADVLVITAGRPQKDGESRLQMIEDNVGVMAKIANSVKSAGFSGITVIASNPVDIMTFAYQRVTGFDPARVISSSCTLDTARLKLEMSKAFDVSPKSIGAFVVGEHGDSSVSTFAHATIHGIPITEELYLKAGLDAEARKAMHTRIYRKAYEIISRKRATYYGIGATLAEVVRSIVRDEKLVLATGALLQGEYGHRDVYAGVPCVIGARGIERTYEFPLSTEEKAQFDQSVSVLKENADRAMAAAL